MEQIIITSHKYPNTPQAEIGKFFMSKDGNYYHQRENDVLFVNPIGLLIASHEVGFLENCNYLECTKKEFSMALNITIHHMNILNGEFK